MIIIKSYCQISTTNTIINHLMLILFIIWKKNLHHTTHQPKIMFFTPTWSHYLCKNSCTKYVQCALDRLNQTHIIDHTRPNRVNKKKMCLRKQDCCLPQRHKYYIYNKDFEKQIFNASALSLCVICASFVRYFLARGKMKTHLHAGTTMAQYLLP